MKITAATADVAGPLFAFIKAHYAPARSWLHDAALHWLRWNMGEGFLVYTMDGEKIVGVAIVRPVMRPADGRETCRFDPEGPCLFVDLTVAPDPLARGLLLGTFRQRFGLRETVAFLRGPHRGGPEKLHVYPIKPWFDRMIRPLLIAYPATS